MRLWAVTQRLNPAKFHRGGGNKLRGGTNARGFWARCWSRMAALTSSAQAQTTPQYDYDGAIRERVYIPNGLDADRDGIEDRSAIEIMRPKELGQGCAGDHRAEPVLHAAPAASSSASASATSTTTA